MRFSDSVLALIIALISVLSIVIPNFVSLFENPRTEISAYLVESTQQSGAYMVTVWVTNVGDRPGFIKGCAVTPQDVPSAKEISGVVSTTPRELGAGTSREVRISFEADERLKPDTFSKARMTLSIINFDSTTQTVDVLRGK